MAKKLHLVHVKSNVLGKAPSAETINYGEIAINYNADSPALYIRDDEDNVVDFIARPYFEKIVGTGVTENDGVTITPLSEIIEQDEQTVSAALNDLNNRKADKSYVDEAISASTIEVDDYMDSASTNPVENRVIYQVIEEDERIIAEAFNDLNDRKADISYVDQAISASTLEVDDHLDSASTNPVENRAIYDYITDNELVIAASLNDLNNRKADKTYVDEAISASTLEVDDHLDSGSTNPLQNAAIYRIVEEDERIIAEAFNDLNDRKADKEYVEQLVSASTIEVDDELTSGGTNPVQGGVIHRILIQDEIAIASSLNDLNDRKADKTYVNDYVDDAISEVRIEVDSYLDSASTNPVENRAIYQAIIDDEEVISTAFNDLNDRKADKSYVDAAVSSITIDVDTQLDSASTNPVENRVIYNALNNVHIDVDSALSSSSTNPVENRAVWQAIVDDELITASALNEINDRIGEISAMTEDYAHVSDFVITAVTETGVGSSVTSVTLTNKVLTANKGDVGTPIETTLPASGFIPNVFYNIGANVTGAQTFTLATPADSSIVNHYYIAFNTGSTAPTITWPSGISWYGGNSPVIVANKHYEVSIINNIGVYMEV